MTVEELLSRISSAELTEWIAVWEMRAKEAEQRRRSRG